MIAIFEALLHAGEFQGGCDGKPGRHLRRAAGEVGKRHRRSILEGGRWGRNPQLFGWSDRGTSHLEGVSLGGGDRVGQSRPGTRRCSSVAQGSEAAITWSERAVEQAKSIGDGGAPFEGLRHARLGDVRGQRVDQRPAVSRSKVVEQLGDLLAQANVLSSLGFLCVLRGASGPRLETFDRSRVISEDWEEIHSCPPTRPATWPRSTRRGNLR